MISTINEDDVVIRVVSSSTTLEEIILHSRDNMEWQTHHVLWDLSGMRFHASDPELARSFFSRFKEIAEQRQNSMKTALLAGSDLAFGMSRMFGTLVSDTDYRIKVFRDKQQALQWLLEDPES